ncbi:MAG: hypothetical protein ACWA5R_05540 [bacterium]
MDAIDLNYVLSLLFYGAVGYAGGWLFSGTNDLVGRRGLILAALIVLVVFLANLLTMTQLAAWQDWYLTGAYSAAFLVRFFKHG